MNDRDHHGWDFDPEFYRAVYGKEAIERDYAEAHAARIQRDRLIAKAPDMLALLKDCEESFTADDSYALLRDACRKLIAEIEQ